MIDVSLAIIHQQLIRQFHRIPFGFEGEMGQFSQFRVYWNDLVD